MTYHLFGLRWISSLTISLSFFQLFISTEAEAVSKTEYSSKLCFICIWKKLSFLNDAYWDSWVSNLGGSHQAWNFDVSSKKLRKSLNFYPVVFLVVQVVRQQFLYAYTISPHVPMKSCNPERSQFQTILQFQLIWNFGHTSNKINMYFQSFANCLKVGWLALAMVDDPAAKKEESRIRGPGPPSSSIVGNEGTVF